LSRIPIFDQFCVIRPYFELNGELVNG
jgi:hypothetical protein